MFFMNWPPMLNPSIHCNPRRPLVTATLLGLMLALRVGSPAWAQQAGVEAPAMAADPRPPSHTSNPNGDIADRRSDRRFDRDYTVVAVDRMEDDWLNSQVVVTEWRVDPDRQLPPPTVVPFDRYDEPPVVVTPVGYDSATALFPEDRIYQLINSRMAAEAQPESPPAAPSSIDATGSTGSRGKKAAKERIVLPQRPLIEVLSSGS